MWSSAWTAHASSTDPTAVVLSAGADQQLAVDGLDAATISTIERWCRDGVANAHTEAERRVVSLLADVGAVVHPVSSAIAVVASPDDSAGDIGLTLREELGTTTQLDVAELVVVVRTGATWPHVPDGKAHLGVDVSMHHTVVLGPFVIPGVSACLDCLDQRMAHRWGRAAVPDQPLVKASPAIVAELVRMQLEAARRGPSPLVNATIVWDLEQGTTDRQNLYKLVGCSRCASGRATGRVELPWKRGLPWP